MLKIVACSCNRPVEDGLGEDALVVDVVVAKFVIVEQGLQVVLVNRVI